MRCDAICGCYRIHVLCAADGWHVQTFLKLRWNSFRQPEMCCDKTLGTRFVFLSGEKGSKNVMPCRQIQCNNVFASTITIIIEHAMSAIYRNIHACGIVFRVFVCFSFAWIESDTNQISFGEHNSSCPRLAWAKVIKFWCAYYLSARTMLWFWRVFSNHVKVVWNLPLIKWNHLLSLSLCIFLPPCNVWTNVMTEFSTIKWVG